jgi:mercuric ion binding protein
MLNKLISVLLLSGSLLYSSLGMAVDNGTIANTNNVKLYIENMTCAMCHITIKKSLDRIDGILGIKFDKKALTATVKYDKTKVDVNKITETTKKAGYPSKPIN